MRKRGANDLRPKAQQGFKQASRDSEGIKSRLAFLRDNIMEHQTMDIEYWRKEIDGIDDELLRLLNMRARLALKVGALKKTANLPICDPVREHSVLARLKTLNSGPLDEHAVGKLFRRIIRESRRIESGALETTASAT